MRDLSTRVRGRTTHRRRSIASATVAGVALSLLPGTASASESPRAEITAVRNHLAGLAPSDDRDTRNLERAIANLDAARSASRWVDGDRLVPRRGLSTHKSLEHAVTSLSLVRTIDVAPMLTRLTGAARSITRTALFDADRAIRRAEHGDRNHLRTAMHHRSKADRRHHGDDGGHDDKHDDKHGDKHRGKHDDKHGRAGDWGQAWHDAQKAIDHANKACRRHRCQRDEAPPQDDENALRQNALVCGDSRRDVTASYPTGTDFATTSGCTPDTNTQVLFVTSSGAEQAATLATAWTAFVQGGGIVITELGASDEVFSAIFEPVAQGTFRGQCMDNVMPVVLHSTTDTIWTENALATTAPSQSGCGFDLGHYPGITPLGGWSSADVSLARRDLGDGRVWLVEADWADADGGWTSASNTLFGHLITHRR